MRPGTYPVTLEVRDSAGTVLATGTQNLVIGSVVKPSTALKGSISVDKQRVLTGEPVSATYTVTNAGNIDLSNVVLTVRTVHVKNQTIYGILTETASLTLATSVTTTRQIDTTSYAAMDYLVVLQAAINGGPEETIAGSYFRVEGAPTMPALSAPSAGSDVQTLTPVLSVNNASDPNDDKLTYEFELYGDSGLTSMTAAAGGIVQGAGTTSFQVPADLTENSTYYWRSRAYDGKLYGNWMEPSASFRVNVANDPPTAPAIANPVDGTEVSVHTPVLDGRTTHPIRTAPAWPTTSTSPLIGTSPRSLQRSTASSPARVRPPGRCRQPLMRTRRTSGAPRLMTGSIPARGRLRRGSS